MKKDNPQKISYRDIDCRRLASRLFDFSARYRQGFSIIETIVAIAILSVAMVAPLSLAQRGLNASVYARDQIAAFYLGQEVIEVARNLRDSNNLAGKSGGAQWLDGLDACIFPNFCGVDMSQTNGKIIDCSAPSSRDCLLTFNPANGLYGSERDSSGNPLSGRIDSVYKRKFQITRAPVAGDDNGEADLRVTINWMSGIIQKTINVEEKIFNWYPARVI